MNISTMANLLGCVWSLSTSCNNVNMQSCDFPHQGNGGVLDGSKNYIQDSVLVWVDVANRSFNYVDPNDDAGKAALNSWIDASNQFDAAMRNNDLDKAFKMLRQANDSFAAVAPHIRDADLSEYFTQVNCEFGSLLDGGDLDAINNYMITAYSIFKQKLGC